MTNTPDFNEIWRDVEKALHSLNLGLNHQTLCWLRSFTNRLLTSTPISRPTDEAISEAYKYLNAASTDLKACHLLFEAQVFPLAVYHLQQAVEKTTRAYTIGLGQLTPEDLKTHRTPLYVLRILGNRPQEEYAFILDSIKLDISKDTTYRDNYSQVQSLINSDLVGQEDLAKLPYKANDKKELSISTLLTLCDISTDRAVMDKTTEALGILSMCSDIDVTQFSIEKLLRPSHAITLCYLLGAITFVHESTTRYPGSFLEPTDYTSSLGIVQALPDLAYKAAEALSFVSEILSESPDSE